MRTIALREGAAASLRGGVSRRLLLGASASVAALMPTVARSQTNGPAPAAPASTRQTAAVFDLDVNNQVRQLAVDPRTTCCSTRCGSISA